MFKGRINQKIKGGVVMIAVYIAFLLFVGVSVALLYIAKDKEEYYIVRCKVDNCNTGN